MIDDYDERELEVPAELVQQRDEIMAKLSQWSDSETGQLAIEFQNGDFDDALKARESIKTIAKWCEIHLKNEDNPMPDKDQTVELLYDYMLFQYQCGDYAIVRCLALKYVELIDGKEDARPGRKLNALWACFASSLLFSKWKEAIDDCDRIEKELESTTHLKKSEILLQRTWLLHWIMFIVFKPKLTPEGQIVEEEERKEEKEKRAAMDRASEKLVADGNKRIMTTAAPHLLRYLGASLVLNPLKMGKHRREIVALMSQEVYNHSDPIMDFLLALYMRIDFDEAQKHLGECKFIFDLDYFLQGKWELFEDAARHSIFEAYCRIHQVIKIDMIAEKLSLTPEEAERWIVKLIQTAKLEAMIDSAKDQVIMMRQAPNVYHQVMEKTRDLSLRSQVLCSHLDKVEEQNRKQKKEKA